MIKFFLNTYEYKIIYKRILFTAMILMIYILGCNIPVVQVELLKEHSSTFLNVTSATLGGNISTLNIFTLGLGPWLTAMIFVNLVLYRNVDKSMRRTKREKQFTERMLTLVLGTLQAYYTVTFLLQDDVKVNIFFVMLILVTGTMLLVFLADQNGVSGIAGPMPIVMVSIIRNISLNHFPTFDLNVFLIAVMIVIVLLVLLLLIFVELSEYRIHYIDILNATSKYQQPYIAWKINPAGSLAIMLSMSAYFTLSYFYDLIARLLGFSIASSPFNLTSPIGILLFALVLFLLNFALSKFILNPKRLAKDFLKNGNYIDGLMPGEDTALYLNAKANQISFIGSVLTMLIMSVPLLFSLQLPQFSNEIMLLIQLIMLVYIGLNIVETVKTYQYFNKYSDFLKQYY